MQEQTTGSLLREMSHDLRLQRAQMQCVLNKTRVRVQPEQARSATHGHTERVECTQKYVGYHNAASDR